MYNIYGVDMDMLEAIGMADRILGMDFMDCQIEALENIAREADFFISVHFDRHSSYNDVDWALNEMHERFYYDACESGVEDIFDEVLEAVIEIDDGYLFNVDEDI